MEPRNRFRGINSARLCSLAGRYDNPIHTRFLTIINCLKIPALVSNPDFICTTFLYSMGTKPIRLSCTPSSFFFLFYLILFLRNQFLPFFFFHLFSFFLFFAPFSSSFHIFDPSSTLLFPFSSFLPTFLTLLFLFSGLSSIIYLLFSVPTEKGKREGKKGKEEWKGGQVIEEFLQS